MCLLLGVRGFSIAVLGIAPSMLGIFTSTELWVSRENPEARTLDSGKSRGSMGFFFPSEALPFGGKPVEKVLRLRLSRRAKL